MCGPWTSVVQSLLVCVCLSVCVFVCNWQLSAAIELLQCNTRVPVLLHSLAPVNACNDTVVMSWFSVSCADSLVKFLLLQSWTHGLHKQRIWVFLSSQTLWTNDCSHFHCLAMPLIAAHATSCHMCLCGGLPKGGNINYVNLWLSPWKCPHEQAQNTMQHPRWSTNNKQIECN